MAKHYHLSYLIFLSKRFYQGTNSIDITFSPKLSIPVDQETRRCAKPSLLYQFFISGFSSGILAFFRKLNVSWPAEQTGRYWFKMQEVKPSVIKKSAAKKPSIKNISPKFKTSEALTVIKIIKKAICRQAAAIV